MIELPERFIEPPLEDLPRLRQEMTEGERIVFDFFHRNLDPKWEIYVHPHFPSKALISLS